ncbi:MAG: HAMP domain-containing sensor histidine kinase [Chlamydiota bacterium]|nr:HAMP domain-containing sensor histidine kinase [Chlamydiota bacterium]
MKKTCSDNKEIKLKELEESLIDLEQLIYIISHDFRSPIVSLKGFTSELEFACQEIEALLKNKENSISPSLHSSITDIIKSNIHQCLSFINNAAETIHSKNDSLSQLVQINRQQLLFCTLNTGKLVREVLHSFQETINTKNINLLVSELPDTYADRHALFKIFENLIDNAIKFLDPNRPGNILISGFQTGCGTIFSIEDNGRGLQASEIPNVFKLFWRASNQDIKGKGTGLPYTKALVKRLHGSIICNSIYGSGTTFTFTLNQPIEDQNELR